MLWKYLKGGKHFFAPGQQTYLVFTCWTESKNVENIDILSFLNKKKIYVYVLKQCNTLKWKYVNINELSMVKIAIRRLRTGVMACIICIISNYLIVHMLLGDSHNGFKSFVIMYATHSPNSKYTYLRYNKCSSTPQQKKQLTARSDHSVIRNSEKNKLL